MSNKLLNLKMDIYKTKKDKAKILKEVENKIKRAKHIEIACRDLCLHNGLDPDILVCKQMPQYMNYPIPTFILPNPQITIPAWWLYREVIEQALSILEATK